MQWNLRQPNSREGCGLHHFTIQTQNKKLKNFVTFHTKIPSRQISPRPAPALDRIIVAWRHHCVAWHYGHCSAIPRLLFITSIISSRLVQGFDYWILNYFLNLLGFDLSCWLWCPFDFNLIYELLISQP